MLHQVRSSEPTPPRQLCTDVAEGLEAVCLKSAGQKAGSPTGNREGNRRTGRQWQESERRQAEELAARERRRHRLLVNSIPQNIWTAGPDGRLDYVSKQSTDYHGVGGEEAKGDAWQQFVHPDDFCRTGWQALGHVLANRHDVRSRVSPHEGGRHVPLVPGPRGAGAR